MIFDFLFSTLYHKNHKPATPPSPYFDNLTGLLRRLHYLKKADKSRPPVKRVACEKGITL